MQDNPLLILGLAGLGVICFGLFVILFIVVVRYSSSRLFGFFVTGTRRKLSKRGKNTRDELPQSKPARDCRRARF